MTTSVTIVSRAALDCDHAEIGPKSFTGIPSAAGHNTTDGPIPLWALGALGAGLVGIATRRFKKAT
jgi:hypothetical protein